jgi:hypothetical protein
VDAVAYSYRKSASTLVPPGLPSLPRKTRSKSPLSPGTRYSYAWPNGSFSSAAFAYGPSQPLDTGRGDEFVERVRQAPGIHAERFDLARQRLHRGLAEVVVAAVLAADHAAADEGQHRTNQHDHDDDLDQAHAALAAGGGETRIGTQVTHGRDPRRGCMGAGPAAGCSMVEDGSVVLAYAFSLRYLTVALHGATSLLRIVRPGHPWPGVRGRSRCR